MTDSYALGCLSIDLVASKITLHGQPLHVTLLEYRLLACLARRAGNPVPVMDLLREVWGCCSGGTEAQVENCVSRLRQKIEPDPDTLATCSTGADSGISSPHLTTNKPATRSRSYQD